MAKPPPTTMPSDTPGAGATAGRRSFRFGLAALAAVAALLALVFVVPKRAPPPPSPAQPDQAFVDRAATVSPAYARSTAGSLLNDPRAQIVIFVDRALPADDLRAWTVQSATEWKIGADRADTGVVLFVFRDARLARVEIGYGLEGALPDARIEQVLERTLVPAFSHGDYEKGFDEFIAAVRDEMGGDSGWAQAYATALDARDLPWHRRIVPAYRRLPWVLHATWAWFRAEETEGRLAIVMFAGAAAAVFAAMVYFALNTLWRLATLPRNWRNSRSWSERLAAADARRRPLAGAEAAFDAVGAALDTSENIKLLEIFAGAFGFALCFAISIALLLYAEDFATRQGHFGGGGADIVWPGAAR
jgi:uncharacterized membrane protein YgcG